MRRDGKLQELRKAMGYTQEKFANILGIPRTQITMYETGERLPSVMFLLKLRDTFNLSYEWLGEWACELAKKKLTNTDD